MKTSFVAEERDVDDAGLDSSHVAQTSPMQPTDLTRLGDAVEALNDYVAPVLQNIHFAIAENEGRMAVMVMNVETQKVMRYIPHEEVLAIGLSLERLRSLVSRT